MNSDTTIVVCLYNAEKYIAETLNSLEKQTFENFKLLIIDDCSIDTSVSIVDNFLVSSTFDNIEFIKLEENRGTAYIRNYALNFVDTPLMMFFDADDIAKPSLLEKLHNKIHESTSYIAISCYSKYIDEKSNKILGGHFIGPENEEEFKYKAENGKLILIPNVTLFKRKIAIKAGGYRQEGFPSGKIRYQDLSEDLDLWSRMSDFYLKSGNIILTLPEVLFYYRKITSSLSASKQSLGAMQNKIRFIKRNLKLRRAGEEEVDFISYIESLTVYEKIKCFFKDYSAFYYRKAGFLFVQNSYLPFAYYLILSIIFNPFYILDKLKSNILRKH